MTTNQSEFVDLFAKFYNKFFFATAESIELLADLQKKYHDDYESIKLFNKNPDAIDDLINNLPEEKQAVLLKILLKAGKFGKDMVNLFDTTIEEKKKLANQLRQFSSELEKEIKKDE